MDTQAFFKLMTEFIQAVGFPGAVAILLIYVYIIKPRRERKNGNPGGEKYSYLTRLALVEERCTKIPKMCKKIDKIEKDVAFIRGKLSKEE